MGRGAGLGASTREEVRLGLRANWAQFALLVVVNAFVGAMVGMERTILPAIAEEEFHLAARAAVLSFIAVFGVTKALTNYFAGRLSDTVGRKRVLVTGWLIALPVPFLLMVAPAWGWVLLANVFLGVSQGLTWSTTVIMKIDLAGPDRRGFAMGLNEFAGYGAVALAALATGYVAAAYGLRPEPFYLGVAFAVAGLGLSLLAVRETLGHARLEAMSGALGMDSAPLTQREVFRRTSVADRDLSAVSQAGLVNNLNDGMAWGLFPLFYAAAGLSLERIGWLAAIYPAVWGVGQLFTGALSDRIGRKWLIVGGMWVQAAGIAVVVRSAGLHGFATGAVLLGAGTAMVYPTLLAAIGDVAHPSWRASAVGVYRLWRDSGYAIGALLSGLIADALGVDTAISVVAAVTFASGLVVAFRMRETRQAVREGGPQLHGRADGVDAGRSDSDRALREEKSMDRPRIIQLISAAVAASSLVAASAFAYPPAVGILGKSRSCLSCHVSNGPWSDEARTVIDVLDAETKKSLQVPDGTFQIQVPRGEARTVLTVIGRRSGDSEVPRRNAWLYVDPSRIEASALSKFPPGWDVNLPMACRIVGDKLEGYEGGHLTVLPMTVRPTDAAGDAELELQVMLTAGEAVKGQGKEGMIGNYFTRKVLLKVVD